MEEDEDKAETACYRLMFDTPHSRHATHIVTYSYLHVMCKKQNQRLTGQTAALRTARAFRFTPSFLSSLTHADTIFRTFFCDLHVQDHARSPFSESARYLLLVWTRQDESSLYILTRSLNKMIASPHCFIPQTLLRTS